MALSAPCAVYAAAEKVGVAGTVQGSVSDTSSEGAKRALKAGDDIFQNDTIHAETNSKAQILFLDKSALSVTPDSEVKIDSFVYDVAAPGKGSLSLKEVKGAFRFIGGALSKENHVEIKTPVSTIGIRGGIEETHITPSGADAIFIYGHDMTVTDNSGQKLVVTEYGAGITVDRNTPAPVKMSPVAVEHKMEQFNAAARTPPAQQPDTNPDNKGNPEGRKQGDKQGGDSKSSTGGTTSGTGSTTTSGTGDTTSSRTGSTTTPGKSDTTSVTGSTTTSGTVDTTTSTTSTTPLADPVLSTTSTLVKDTTTTSSTSTTQSSTQQAVNNPLPAYGGLYNYESFPGHTTYDQGSVQMSINGNALLGNFVQLSTNVTKSLTLPAPAGGGFSPISVTIGGVAYTGAVYATPGGAMFDYYLQSLDTTKQLFAVAGLVTPQAKWAAAAAATAAAHSATNGIAFYNVFPNLSANEDTHINGIGDFTNPGKLAFAVTPGTHLVNSGVAINYTNNAYVGGRIIWDTDMNATTAPSHLMAAYGTVTPAGSTLASGSIFEFDSSSSNPLTSTDGGHAAPGFQRTTPLVYTSGSGTIDGFVIEGVEPNPLGPVPPSVYTAPGYHILAPVGAAPGSAGAIASTSQLNSGTLYGFAAGNFQDVNAASLLHYNSSLLDEVTVTKNAATGQVSADILMHNIDTPISPYDISADFGAAGGGTSALVDDRIFAAGQNSMTYQSFSTVTDPTKQSGVFMAADVAAGTLVKCTACDYVQWGVWAGDIDVGTGTPNVKNADMIPVVFGSPTPDSYLSSAPSGTVAYNGVLYGDVNNTTINAHGHQEGTFVAMIDLNNRQVNSFDGSIGAIQHFGFNTPASITSATYGGGTAPVFNSSVTGLTGSTGSITGTINGALFGPTAQNVGGNFDVQQFVSTPTPVNLRATGIYMGTNVPGGVQTVP